MSIKIYGDPDSKTNASPLIWIFPGGEVGVKFHESDYRKISPWYDITIEARLCDSNSLLALAQVSNILKQKYRGSEQHLILPYLPYSRQDRACDTGEDFALKTFAGIINGLNFTTVTTYDPHSDVAAGVFRGYQPINVWDFIGRFKDSFVDFLGENYSLVSPDAGANKKMLKVAKALGKDSFIRADKVRDVSTGKIIKTEIYEDVPKNILICDDICDGGATFIALALELKERGAERVALYTTHGIFSQGLDVLKNGGIDKVFYTDTYSDVEGNDGKEDFATMFDIVGINYDTGY